MNTTLEKPTLDTGNAPKEYRWTVEATYRADAARAFNEPLLVELVRGRLIEHSGHTPRHTYTVTHIASMFRKTLEPQLSVFARAPIHVSADTEPTTDVLAVMGDYDDYWERHPTPSDAALLVEVADITAEYDTEDKALLYAKAGVQEYWVALTETRTLLIHRNPTTDGYMTVSELGLSERVAPLALPEAYFTVRDLLGVPAEEGQPERNGTSSRKHDRPVPHEVHWTADAFDRACDAGVFGPDARLELVRGRVVERMGQGALHSILTTFIAERLRAVLSPRLLVREEKTIRIAFDGEPVIDIMVVNRTILDAYDYYAANQVTPDDVLLAVEVSVTSAQQDTGDKALFYAQAGIADYWVVLAEEKAIMVHREPSPDGYAAVTRLNEMDTLMPLAASDATLAVRDLLGASG